MSDRPTPGHEQGPTEGAGRDWIPPATELREVRYLVFQGDDARLRRFAEAHRLGDTAMAIRRLLDIAYAQEDWRARSQVLEEALRNLVKWAEEARGHYGIEEVAGLGAEATAWDEVQDALQDAARDGRAALGLPDEEGEGPDLGYEARSAHPGDCVPSPGVDAVTEKLAECVAALERSGQREKESQAVVADVTRDHAQLGKHLRHAYRLLSNLDPSHRLQRPNDVWAWRALDYLREAVNSFAPKAAGPERPEVAHKQESPSVGDVSGEGER